MPNRRDLKKEINEAVNDFAGMCMSYLETHTGEKALEVDMLIDKVADLLDDVMNQINNHSHMGAGKETRDYFVKVENEFDDSLKELEGEFSKLTS